MLTKYADGSELATPSRTYTILPQAHSTVTPTIRVVSPAPRPPIRHVSPSPIHYHCLSHILPPGGRDCVSPFVECPFPVFDGGYEVVLLVDVGGAEQLQGIDHLLTGDEVGPAPAGTPRCWCARRRPPPAEG